MKEKYTKPELESKPYAQFENVLACCNKNSSLCIGTWGGSSYSSHQNHGNAGRPGRPGRPGYFGHHWW